MKCMHCRGRMEHRTAPFQVDRKGYHLMFDAIPAWVCSQCGEVYFEEAEVEAIQDVLRTLDEGTERLAVAG